MQKYVRYKIEQTNEYIKITQLIKVQQFINEFGFTSTFGSKKPKVPAMPGSALSIDVIDDKPARRKQHKQYCTVAGITYHIVQ